MGAEIREAQQHEYAEVGRLLQDAYRQYMAGHEEEPEWVEYMDHDIPDVEGRLPTGLPLVAVVDGRIDASVTYYAPGHGGVEGWENEFAVIRLLGVHPRARGMGLGRLLTEECLRRAREDGAAAVGLNNHESMIVARAMYVRMGFEPYPERAFLAGDTHVDAFVLRSL